MNAERLYKLMSSVSLALYTVDAIMSLILYSIMTKIPLGTGIISLILSSLSTVPLISAMFSVLIISIILMSLKYAELYGIGKSVLAIVSYLYFYFIVLKVNPSVVSYINALSGIKLTNILLFTLTAIAVAEIVVLYYYHKAQKEMFG